MQSRRGGEGGKKKQSAGKTYLGNRREREVTSSFIGTAARHADKKHMQATKAAFQTLGHAWCQWQTFYTHIRITFCNNSCRMTISDMMKWRVEEFETFNVRSLNSHQINQGVRSSEGSAFCCTKVVFAFGWMTFLSCFFSIWTIRRIQSIWKGKIRLNCFLLRLLWEWAKNVSSVLIRLQDRPVIASSCQLCINTSLCMLTTKGLVTETDFCPLLKKLISFVLLKTDMTFIWHFQTLKLPYTWSCWIVQTQLDL